MYLLIFIVDLVIAFAWAKGVRAVAEHRCVAAGLWSGFITMFAAVSIISYTIDHFLLIPAIVGSAVGTYLSVKYGDGS